MSKKNSIILLVMLLVMLATKPLLAQGVPSTPALCTIIAIGLAFSLFLVYLFITVVRNAKRKAKVIPIAKKEN